ncbi:MAG: hypothetical protein IRZ14_19025 [Chloroflexi bacterium]|nr:hypothetical protein [Chloroflexota bacterium]
MRITVTLQPRDYLALRELALREQRTIPRQASWLLLQALQTAAPAQQHSDSRADGDDGGQAA